MHYKILIYNNKGQPSMDAWSHNVTQ